MKAKTQVMNTENQNINDSPNKYSIREIISIFIPHFKNYVKPVLPVLIQAVLCLFVINLLYLIIPFFQKHFIDDGLVGKNLGLIIRIIIAIVVTSFLTEFVLTLWDYLYSFLASRLCYNIEKDLYLHILKLPMSYFDNHQAGEILKRVLDSISMLNIINLFLFDILNNISVILMSIIAGLVINPFLVLISVFFIPISLVNNYFQGKVSRKNEEERWNVDRALSSEQTEAVFGIRTIKAFGIESKVYRKYLLLRLKYRQVEFKFKRMFSRLKILNAFFSNLETFLIMGVAGLLVISGKMTIGDWMAYQMIISRVTIPLRQLIDINVKLQTNIVVLKRLDELIREQEEKHVQGEEIKMKKGTLHFKKVCFGYIRENQILNNINFKLEKGQSLALVGRSGVGKSTLANLILNFYLPSKGEILIDGVNIREYGVKNLRDDVAMVLQDSYLFSGSIIDNLKLCSTTKKKTDIEAACKMACAHEFIMGLPDGYNTEVGERGTKLSGGQKQRVALAQAILKKPKILILDEATSHLDIETEKKVQEAFYYLMKKSTSIIIAHRLSTIKHANCIAVLEKGEIVELGRHDELVRRRDSYYSKMYSSYLSM